MGDVTELLSAAGRGDREAAGRLIEVLYAELRRMAARQLRRDRSDHTLQPTALVNEIYLRFVSGSPQWRDRHHFLAAAAQAMRQVLIDHARRRAADKRGGGLTRVTFDGMEFPAHADGYDALVVDQALTALDSEQPRLARLVELRIFTGLSVEDCAAVLDVSPATIKRDWVYAKAWLVERLHRAE